MPNMIDLDSFHKHYCYSNFETRNLNALKFKESTFGPVSNNHVNIETSIFNEKLAPFQYYFRWYFYC